MDKWNERVCVSFDAQGGVFLNDGDDTKCCFCQCAGDDTSSSMNVEVWAGSGSLAEIVEMSFLGQSTLRITPGRTKSSKRPYMLMSLQARNVEDDQVWVFRSLRWKIGHVGEPNIKTGLQVFFKNFPLGL